MKRKKILANIAIVLTVTAGVLLAGGCKKQPKCGCDGDALDTLVSTHVYISYNATSNSASFYPIWDNYSLISSTRSRRFTAFRV